MYYVLCICGCIVPLAIQSLTPPLAGEHKYKDLGIPYPLENQRHNTAEEIKRAVDILKEGGLKVLCI